MFYLKKFKSKVTENAIQFCLKYSRIRITEICIQDSDPYQNDMMDPQHCVQETVVPVSSDVEFGSASFSDCLSPS